MSTTTSRDLADYATPEEIEDAIAALTRLATSAELSKDSRAEVQKALVMLKRGFLPLPHFRLPPSAAAVLEKFQNRWNAAAGSVLGRRRAISTSRAGRSGA